MSLVFSGIQPTGNLHLGNYLGAIRHWVAMQHDHPSLFCIVDMHAITVPQDPAALTHATRETAAAYIASGIDPVKSVIFNQSMVPGHAELTWILSCITPLGWLNRMTQFKEKAGKDREQACLGLYSYPVLMAADILLYKATHVPVGDDQKQHLELARDIAGAFNRQFNTDYFTLPEPLIKGEAARIMSLRDGTKKMSKSDISDYSRITLTDDADIIAKKIRKATTDAFPTISYDPENRPEIANLLTIYAAVTGTPRASAVEQFASSGTASFKQALTDAAVTHLAPITEKMRQLMDEPAYLDSILRAGAIKARVIADQHMNEIKKITGFLNVN
jgi:tryptophanyl-tRNA synthetase